MKETVCMTNKNMTYVVPEVIISIMVVVHIAKIVGRNRSHIPQAMGR